MIGLQKICLVYGISIMYEKAMQLSLNHGGNMVYILFVLNPTSGATPIWEVMGAYSTKDAAEKAASLVAYETTIQEFKLLD